MTTFQDLPVEIRGMIYEQALRDSECFGLDITPHIDDCRINFRHYSRKLSGFCYTNKTECDIALSIFLRNATFIVCCVHTVMRNLLDSFPANIAYKAVRNIEYRHIMAHTVIDYYGAMLYRYVLSRCTGLQKLTIGFSIREITELCSFKPLPGAEISDNKIIEAIFGCMNLREIKLEVTFHRIFCLDDALKGLREVAVWIKQEFEKKGKQDVEVKIKAW
tara:strand:+ start:784 stop:1440 length:657 start_codon:yes stop_codon:yes gene_type:complete